MRAQHAERHPCRIPVAARPRWQLRHQRRAERRQSLLGRTAGLQPRLPARSAGAARRAHPPGGGRRERRRHRRGGQFARQPPGGVRSRSNGRRNDNRTLLEPRARRLPGVQFPALVAPGTGIRSTGLGGVDATGLAGTSFAAPHVAGALALLLQVAPQLTATEQATLLTESAIDLGAPGADSTFGAGLLDLIGAARRLHTPALDFDPPALSAAADADARLTLRADDAFSSIAGGEWWADADPGIGAGQPLTAADGLLDSRSEGLVASTAALAPGPHLLGMRARDAAGNWSAATMLLVSVPGLATPLAAVPDVPAPAVPVAPAAPAPAPRDSSSSQATASSTGWGRGHVASEPSS